MLAARTAREGEIICRRKVPLVVGIEQEGVLASMVVPVVRQNVENHATECLFEVPSVPSDSVHSAKKAIIVDARHMRRCFHGTRQRNHMQASPWLGSVEPPRGKVTWAIFGR